MQHSAYTKLLDLKLLADYFLYACIKLVRKNSKLRKTLRYWILKKAGTSHEQKNFLQTIVDKILSKKLKNKMYETRKN